MPSIPGESATRSRPERLSSEADLAANQEAFFRAHLGQPAEEPLGSLSFSKPSTSATAALLKPVEERKVSRRRRARRPAPPTAGFPSSDADGGKEARRFAREKEGTAIEAMVSDGFGHHVGDEATTTRAAHDNNVAHGEQRGAHKVPRRAQQTELPPAEWASQEVARMSPEQIREAQEEIAAMLDPETIKFLRERGDDRVPADSEPSRAVPWSQSALLAGGSALEEGRAHAGNSNQGNTGGTAKLGNERTEDEKCLWMSDANSDLPDQRILDRMLSEAVSGLGELAERRFNLTGEKLTATQVESLPTHLGLHHHGASPSSAGYTLSEVLLLTRSTVLQQRILSLRVLAALVNRHRDEIVDALLRSGGIALAFSDFPSRTSFDLALTNQIAYLEAVEALIDELWHFSRSELVTSLYFSSRFYSSTLRERPHPLLSVLAQSGCVAVLTTIAEANALHPDRAVVALRSLNAIRCIVQYSAYAARQLLFGQGSLTSLQRLAVGLQPMSTSTVLLACDILAQAVINVAWDDSGVVEELSKTVCSDGFLEKIAAHVSWFLRLDSKNSVTAEQHQAAKGAMRLLRSAVCLELGVSAFSRAAPAICVLATGDEATAAEAYLALEAYAHSLYTSAVSPSKCSDELFLRHQLEELAPVALSACSVFISSTGQTPPSVRAAAGHFAATVLALSTIPVDRTVVSKLLIECSSASNSVREMSLEGSLSLTKLQTFSSVCHAGARLLSSARLDPGYAKREVHSLLEAAAHEARFEKERTDDGCVPWRPVANACVEWTGSLAKVDCCKETVELCLRVLPFVFEPQAVLDLFSRCLVNVRFLKLLIPSLQEEEAKKCAQDILPITQTALSDVWARRTAESTDGKLHRGVEDENAAPLDLIQPFSILFLLEQWLRYPEAIDSALILALGFYKSNVVDPLDLFWILLGSPFELLSSPSSRFCDVLLLSAIGAVSKNHSLIREGGSTGRSALSTTPNSKFSDAITTLNDTLVARGPSVFDPLEEKGEPLSSVLFSVMWGKEVDISLRELLWRTAVDECGGGGLFRNARYIYEDGLGGVEGSESIEDNGVFLSLVFGSLVKGLLLGERCPGAMGVKVADRLTEAIEAKGEGMRILSQLRDSMSVDQRAVILASLEGILEELPVRTSSGSVLIEWYSG